VIKLNVLIVAAIVSFSGNALAGDALLLDPQRTTCRLGAGAEYRTKRCDIYVGELIVHEGRSTDVPTANGDCVKCESVLEDAKSLGKNVRMLRGYWGRDIADWHMEDFFIVNSPDKRCE